MRLAWTDDGWADYVYWQTEEPLKYRPGYSRTINEKDRLVYDMENDELVIFSCRFH